ncbi:MAG: hypothetical protein IJU27_07500 [Bacteroidales bacterium]|nr:hypothetical protein [Bacteroidales bacterium]
MPSLVYIDACVREKESRTRRIAEPVVEALGHRYSVTAFHLPEMKMDIHTGDPLEQGSPYLKALSRLWGLGEVTTIAESNMDYSSPEQIEAKIAAAVAEGLAVAEYF